MHLPRLLETPSQLQRAVPILDGLRGSGGYRRRIRTFRGERRLQFAVPAPSALTRSNQPRKPEI